MPAVFSLILMLKNFNQCQQSGFLMYYIVIILLVASGLIVIMAKLILLWGLQQQQFLRRYHLRQEVWQMVLLIDKAIQRAGYCRVSQCKGISLSLSDSPPCLILANDTRPISDAAAGHHFEHIRTYRIHQKQLQVSHEANCQVGQWESLTDPASINIDGWHTSLQGNNIMIKLTASAGTEVISLNHRIIRNNP